MNSLSFNAAATDPIAVPHIPRKWKWRGSALLTRILYAASGDLATTIPLERPPAAGKMHGANRVEEREEKSN